MSAHGLYVPLTTDEYDRLCNLARAERRPLRDQAAVLLARALSFEQLSSPTIGHAFPAPAIDQDNAQQAESGASA